MISDFPRWRQAIALLSLDLSLPLFEALWVPIPDGDQFQKLLRYAMRAAAANEKYRYHYEFGGILHQLLKTAQENWGNQAVLNLIRWVDVVLLNGGPDRIQESFWRPIIRTAAMPSNLAQLGNAGQACVSIAAQMHETKLWMDAYSRQVEEASLSSWDEEALAIQELDRATVSATYVVMVNCNAFVDASALSLSSLSPPELDLLFEFGRREAESFGINSSDLFYPGDWLYGYQAFSMDRRKRWLTTKGSE